MAPETTENRPDGVLSKAADHEPSKSARNHPADSLPASERLSYSYRFGTAEFDEARRELRVAGLPVELEPRVMDLLAYLLHRVGELISKDELLREVWVGRVTVEKVLPNAIAKLRRALGQDNAERIVTQSRVGYRMDGPVSRVVVGHAAEQGSILVAGAAIPQRPSFRLQRRLSSHRGSEVWLAEHSGTRELRVFKFALDADRLRALKRETTLLRVLHEGAAERDSYVSLRDWNFEIAPYFVELDYAGQNLLEWAKVSLDALTQDARLALFLRIAKAVETAHALGVLHKDIKPANVLIQESPTGLAVKLTDFGSGRMLEPERLEELGITRQGLTLTEDVSSDSHSGTPLYLAPELYSGQTPTVQSDVYALGVLLFQLLSGRLREPMASGWQAAIDEPLLRDDIESATHRDPSRRLASVALLTSRVRRLSERQAKVARNAERAAEVQRTRLALARSKARRPYLLASIALLALGLVSAVILRADAERARLRAEHELRRANAMLQFIEEDLISRANPLVLGKGADAPLRDVLLAARDRLQARFSQQPMTAAPLHLSLSHLFNTLDLWPEAEAEASRALVLYQAENGSESIEALRALAIRVRVLSRQSRFDQAERDLATLMASAQHSDEARAQHALAASTYHLARGSYSQAVPMLQAALAQTTDRGLSQTQRDSLVIDLIAALGLSGKPDVAMTEYQAFATDLAARPVDTALVLALARLSVARSVSLQGDHAQAEALLLAAKEVIGAQLGSEHSRMLGLLNELMGVYFRQSDWQRVIPIAEEVHRRLRAKLGDAHNASWISLGNVGRAYLEFGKAKDASERLREAYRRMTEVVGVENPQTQDVAFALAAAELTQGRSAAPWLATLDAALLEQSRATGRWQDSLQLLLGLQAAVDGNYGEARQQLSSAVDALKDDAESARSQIYRHAKKTLEGLPD